MLFVVGIYLYIFGDLYLVKILYWIKMKMIEVDDEFYSYIVSYIKYIGESVFDILWCMLKFFVVLQFVVLVMKEVCVVLFVIVEVKLVKMIKDKVCVMCEFLFLDEYVE